MIGLIMRRLSVGILVLLVIGCAGPFKVTDGAAPQPPDIGAGLTPYPPPPPQPGPGLFGVSWDSGPQQCDMAGKKILYRFWKVSEPLAWSPDHWVVYDSVGTEDSGPTGWHAVTKLFSVSYSFGYGSVLPGISGSKNVVNKWADEGVLVTGDTPGGFSTIAIRVERAGGQAGMHVIWPGGGCEWS